MQSVVEKGKTLRQLLEGWQNRLPQSPVAVLSALVLTIFLAEAVIMGFLHLVPGLPRWVESWLDSTLLIVVLYPWLIFLVKRPFLLNIKERERTETALSQSEYRLRMILDNNPYFMAVKDEKGKILLANKPFAGLYGTSVDRMIGVPHAHLHAAAGMDQKEFQRSLAADREVIADGKPRFSRELLTHRDGSAHWYQVSRLPVSMREGDRCVLTISGQITRQIRAEEAMRRSRDELERRVEERTAELMKVNTDLRGAVSAHMRAEEELLHSRAQLQNLSAGLESLLEEERTRISREVHDELGQSLTALKFDLTAMGKKLPEGQTLLAEKTGSMVKLVDSIIKAVQKISLELRPGLLDDLGLVAAIEWQAKEFHERTGIPCRVVLSPRELDIDPERSTAIFRIFQEALTNIVRHAAATKVEANLGDRDGMLTLEVRDNGRGITKEQASGSKSLGLIGIRERVRRLEGEVLIDGSPHAGTVIRVTIPSAGARACVPSTGSMVTTT